MSPGCEVESPRYTTHKRVDKHESFENHHEEESYPERILLDLAAVGTTHFTLGSFHILNIPAFDDEISCV